MQQSKNHHTHDRYGGREIGKVVQIEAMKMAQIGAGDRRDVVLGTVG